MTQLSATIGTCSRRISSGGVRRWSFTFAAHAISICALDAVATAAGIALVAAQVFGEANYMLVLTFLASTYVAWGAGLRANLRANWNLLEATGTSTNALSKAAYDLAGRWSGSRRRFAAGAGYLATELGMEVPYYAGAIGVALLSDAVSSTEALVFLGGANLGAAGYVYALAWVTRAFLDRRSARGYASFDRDWVPKEYLTNYYTAIDADERHTIAFFVDAVRSCEPGEPILFFGVGPTLHHVFPVACRASEIHLGDYLPANLSEIERWIARDPDAHYWRPFVSYVLQCEGGATPTESRIVRREEVTRAKITRLMEVDIRSANPLGGGAERPTVRDGDQAYCADSATASRAIWETYMRRIVELVRPGGTFITAALRHTHGYLIDGKQFPVQT